MAFKPTRNQTTGVQPVGVVPASGLRNMAQTFNNISQTLTSEMSKDRQMLYDKAILDAQAAGINAVKYDDDGKLIPLTEAGFNPNMFYKADEAKVKSVFEQFLQNSYKTAFSVDVTNAAEDAFSKNPNNPEAIKTIRDTYGESVDALPDILKKAVMPNFNMAFTKAISSAQSNVRNLAIEKDIDTKLTRISQIYKDLNHAYLISGGSEEAVDPDVEADLLGEIKQLKADLSLHLPEKQVTKLINNYTTSLQTNALKGTIAKVFDDKGLAGALNEIQKITPDLYQLQGLASGTDPDTIINELRDYASFLHQEDVAVQRSVGDENSGLFQTLDSAILNGKITTLGDLKETPEWNMIENNIERHDVGQNYLNQLTRILRSEIVNDKSENLKNTKIGISNEVSNLLDGANDILRSGVLDTKGMDSILLQAENIVALAQSKDVFDFIEPRIRAIKDIKEKLLINIAKEKNDIGISELNAGLWDGKFGYSPMFLLSDEFAEAFFKEKQINIGTDKKDAMTREQWGNYVRNSYAPKWSAYHEDVKIFAQAISNSKYGPNLKGSKHDKAIEKHLMNKNIIFTSPSGEKIENAIDVNIDVSEDLLLRNPEQHARNLLIRKESIRAAIQRSAVTKQLHPQLVEAFKNIAWKSEEGFNHARNLFIATRSSLQERQEHGPEVAGMLGNMFEREDIGLGWYENISLYNYEMFKLSLKGERSITSANQKLFKDEDGLRFEDFYQEGMNDLFQEKGLLTKFLNMVGFETDQFTDENHKAMAKELMANSQNMQPYNMASIRPMVDLATIQSFHVTSDPTIDKIMRQLVMGKIASGKYDQTTFKNSPDVVVRAAIGDALDTMGMANIGLVVQGDGHIEIMKNPFLKYANQSTAGFSVEPRTSVHVFAQLKRDLANQSELLRKDDRDLPLILKANEPFNPENPSYSAYGVRPNGTLVLRASNWSYDYKRSNDYIEYQKASEAFKEGSIAQDMWRYVPFLDGHIMKTMVRMREQGSNEANVKDYFVRALNKAKYGAYFVTGNKHQFEPWKVDLTNNDLGILLKQIGSLGMYK